MYQSVLVNSIESSPGSCKIRRNTIVRWGRIKEKVVQSMQEEFKILSNNRSVNDCSNKFCI